MTTSTRLVRLEQTDAARADPPLEVVMTRSAWDAALELYYAEHDAIATDPDAHGPAYFHLGGGDRTSRRRAAAGGSPRRSPTRQGDHDWVIEAIVDCDASDEAGDLVMTCTALRELR